MSCSEQSPYTLVFSRQTASFLSASGIVLEYDEKKNGRIFYLNSRILQIEVEQLRIDVEIFGNPAAIGNILRGMCLLGCQDIFAKLFTLRRILLSYHEHENDEL